MVVTSAPTPSGGGILRQVAEAAGSEALRSRVEEISTTLTSRAIYVATMAWEVEEGDTALATAPRKTCGVQARI